MADETKRSVEHATFSLERVFPASKDRVFTGESHAFYDGYEKPEQREQDTGWLLDALGRFLAG